MAKPDTGLTSSHGWKPWEDVRRIDKGERLTHERLTPQAVYYILGVRCEEADVDPLSPHDFRRTFVSDLLDAGVDLATVSRPVLSLPPVLSSSK